MTNQTKIFSTPGVAATHVAYVTDLANNFIRAGIGHGYSAFNIRQVVVTPYDPAFDRNWYTLQVDYYDPSVYE
ncbi:hypothetical protein CJD36_002775 [Flavipsychrobacter stenotrophus]|uniref:Uncharacterized protein n=1 Tax=Flavipsychrobacter stenotrophus TaxID=2077091 RepID=A0A2S7T1K7_9BACT|nr:hypothetical protein [Flavipsychrobacter stenotrophus]PQJ12685.1 hypothetical protein CJD36_002775 [Flavipsychrobacter stenotrophus]